MMDKLIDETSNKYGTYTVLEHIIGTKPTLWMCKCDCGNIIKCSGYDVRNKLKSRRCSKCDPIRVPTAPRDSIPGSIFSTNDGSSIVVIEYNTANKMLVQFTDMRTPAFMASIGNLRNGKYRNPYGVSVGKCGYIGYGMYSQKTHKHVYTVWTGMLSRCADDGSGRKAHSNLSVCDDWRCFQTFATWYYSNIGCDEGWDVDKDLLAFKNSVYSPQTCTLLPREINGRLPKRMYDGCYPRGDNKWVGCYRDFSGKRRTVSGNDRTSVIAECVAKRFSSIQELIIRNDFKIEDVAISRISNMSCYDFVLSEIINYENVHDPK